MQKEDKSIEIVCVANDLEMFNQVIGTNSNMNKYPITIFDNSIENIGISKRYNSYITNNINSESDFWVIFCHQDFGFNKDPFEKIKSFNKKYIYGAIGTAVNFSSFRLLKKYLLNKPSKYFPVKRKIVGQINQGIKNVGFKKFGKKILFEKTVSSLDCCCMIAHSSLINEYNLRFDENLNWHMYVEEFCINAKKTHKICSKVAQFDCLHLGEGNANDDFYACADYVRNKHQLSWIKTTCIND